MPVDRTHITIFPDEDPRNADWIKNVGVGGSARNMDLALLYRCSWGVLSSMRAQDPSLAAPYFAWVHPDYESVDIRLVVVGQETNGWGECAEYSVETSEAVRALMHEYRDFNLGADYDHRAAFWIPVRKLYERLNPGGPESGFVALNASIMDQDKRQPDTDTRDRIISTGLLPEQISALDPHVVVFLTGPTYDEWIDLSFPGVTRMGDEVLAMLVAPGLPRLSFRTYHPGYLSPSGQLDSVFDQIRADVVAGA